MPLSFSCRKSVRVSYNPRKDDNFFSNILQYRHKISKTTYFFVVNPAVLLFFVPKFGLFLPILSPRPPSFRSSPEHRLLYNIQPVFSSPPPPFRSTSFFPPTFLSSLKKQFSFHFHIKRSSPTYCN